MTTPQDFTPMTEGEIHKALSAMQMDYVKTGDRKILEFIRLARTALAVMERTEELSRRIDVRGESLALADVEANRLLAERDAALARVKELEAEVQNLRNCLP